MNKSYLLLDTLSLEDVLEQFMQALDLFQSTYNALHSFFTFLSW